MKHDVQLKIRWWLLGFCCGWLSIFFRSAFFLCLVGVGVLCLSYYHYKEVRKSTV